MVVAADYHYVTAVCYIDIAVQWRSGSLYLYHFLESHCAHTDNKRWYLIRLWKSDPVGGEGLAYFSALYPVWPVTVT